MQPAEPLLAACTQLVPKVDVKLILVNLIIKKLTLKFAWLKPKKQIKNRCAAALSRPFGGGGASCAAAPAASAPRARLR